MATASRRLILQTAAIVLGIIALCTGHAAASRFHPDRAAGAPAAVKVAKAKAVGQARCNVRARSRRPQVRRRRRCVRNAGDSQAVQPLYWGATIGSQLTGEQAPWDMNAVSKFEGIAGKPVSLIQFFQPFSNCGSGGCKPYPFPLDPMESIRQHGSIPVLSWSSAALPSSLNQPDFQLSDVIEGHFDSFLTEFAEAAKAWGHPFFLRFDWEMNASWMPWSEQVNGNASGQYVAAWRHVHDIFTAVGATNATWTWCPYVDPSGSLQDLASLYPGDEYVNWTCLDGYNWGTNPSSPRGWRSFDQVFSSTYQQVTEAVAPTKPMMIGEMGSSEDGGSKAAWISDALEKVPTDYPRVRAMMWFDTVADGMDWPIETSAAASSAFAQGIQSGPFTGNSYAGLPAAPVQPPS
jgi:hypothetical protein